MMRQIKAVLFDCDGVLLDSEPAGCVAVSQALAEAGVSLSPDEARRLFCGFPVGETMAWMDAAGVDGRAIHARSEEILFTEDVPVMPGIAALLAGLDLPIAVCSNSSSHRLRETLHRTELAAMFGPHVYSADQVARPKPAPDLLVMAAARLGVAVEDCIFIDDNVPGLGAGVAAGCHAIGFIGPSEHRIGHEAALMAAGADEVIAGVPALAARLAQWLGRKAA